MQEAKKDPAIKVMTSGRTVALSFFISINPLPRRFIHREILARHGWEGAFDPL